jgi:serine/threonine-protein kinase
MRTCPQCQRAFPNEVEFCPRDGTPLPAAQTATEAELAAGLARKYRIIRRLGAGGMGTVFFAEQIAVGNRPVALKVLLRKLLDDPEFLLRFQNEAASTGRIHHPNVVTIYESGQADDGTPYIAMEYLEGGTLRQALEARGALPVAECAEILQQVARGLNAAHKLGIIHRDLKPDNIFLTRSDEGETLVKIVDFGIAKLRESASHTLTGTVLGTPAYMSFEQASGVRSDQLDARSDIYSLGVVLYEMLTGRVPFHSDTPLGYVRKHLTEQPPPFRAVAPGLPVPPQVENAVMKALRKDRAERHPSVLDFAHELRSAAEAGTKRFPPSEAGIGGQRLVSSRDDMIRPLQKEAQLVAGMVGASSPISARGHELQGIGLVPAAEPPSKTKYILPALLALVLVAVGVWYAFRPSEQPKTGEKSAGGTPAKPAAAPPGMVYIPGGTFMMGRDNAQDPEETPAHSVTVAPFYVDKVPVTTGEYAGFKILASKGGSPPPAGFIVEVTPGSAGSYPTGHRDRPVTNVSWEDAAAYCKWQGKRLPTEAEWEFAARGTDGRLYPWGNEYDTARTNSLERGLGHPESVTVKDIFDKVAAENGASPFGVFDMSGNVWQWCEDGYKPYPGRQPTFEIPANAKVIRGGSFKSDKEHVTATTRNLDLATSRSPAIGFRCAK